MTKKTIGCMAFTVCIYNENAGITGGILRGACQSEKMPKKCLRRMIKKRFLIFNVIRYFKTSYCMCMNKPPSWSTLHAEFNDYPLDIIAKLTCHVAVRGDNTKFLYLSLVRRYFTYLICK